MVIRKAKPEDVEAVMRIINQAKAYFKANGIDQWQRGNPNEDVIRADIAEGTSYVIDDNGTVVGTCCLKAGPDENYAEIYNGAWLNDEPYMVIHRIAVDPERKGQRLGALFFDHIAKMAEDGGLKNIRVDTHPENMSMQKLIARNEYSKCGEIYVGEHELRYAYQKVLK